MTTPPSERVIEATRVVNRTVESVIDTDTGRSASKTAKAAVKAARKALRRAGWSDDEIEAEFVDLPEWARFRVNAKAGEIEDARKDAAEERRVVERDLASQLRLDFPNLSDAELARYVEDPDEGSRLIAEKRRSERAALIKRANGSGGGFDPDAVLSVADLDELADPKHLVAELLPEGSVTQFVAAPSVGKTIAMTEIAVAVAVGRPAFGELATTGPRRVLMLLGEGGAGIRKRIEAVAIYRALTDDERARLDENLFVYPAPVNLQSTDDRDAIRRLVDDRKIDLAVADTFSTHTPGIEENTAGEVAAVIANLRYMVAGRPKGAAVYTHHVGKGGSLSSRGSSAHESNVDNAVSMERNGDLVALTMTKVKDGADGFQMTFRKVVVELPASTSAGGKHHPASTSVAFEVVAAGAGVALAARKSVAPARFDALLAAFTEIVQAQFADHSTPSVTGLRALFRKESKLRHEWSSLGGIRNGLERELADSMAAAGVVKLGQAGLAVRLYPPDRDLPPAVEPIEPPGDLDLLPFPTRQPTN